jgi:hypothetical protein
MRWFFRRKPPEPKTAAPHTFICPKFKQPCALLDIVDSHELERIVNQQLDVRRRIELLEREARIYGLSPVKGEDRGTSH